MDIKAIIKKIDKYEYVSFDMFDTVIKRNVKRPTDVFRLVEMWYEREYNIPVKDFSKRRIEAEKSARQGSSREEVTLDEIYSNIKGYDANTVQSLKEIEIKVEREVCICNPDLKPVYDYCIKQNKKIYIVSDMYLPGDILRDILAKNGLKGFERLYVSSDVGLSKATGNIFGYVLKDINISAWQIIHIGDSVRRDFIRPRLLGINSIPIPRHVNHLLYSTEKGMGSEDLFTYQTLTAFINNHLSGEQSRFYKLGYEIYGPLLYGFLSWVLSFAERDGKSRILFLARDGYVMQQAFEIMNESDSISADYFFVSRRSLYAPALSRDASLEKLLSYASFQRVFPLKTLVERFGLNCSQYKDKLKKYSLTEDTLLDRGKVDKNENFVSFYSEIEKDLRANSEKEYGLFLEYLEQMKVEGSIALVDIGWRCSIQKALMNILKDEGVASLVSGYYLGVSKDAKIDRKDIGAVKGFLMHYGDDFEKRCSIAAFIAIIEIFFTAPYGTVERYEKNNGVISPVLGRYEYQNSDGSFMPEVDIIGQLQKGALAFVKDFSSYPVFKDMRITKNIAFQNIFEFGTNPNKDDAKTFGDFIYHDTTVAPVAKPDRLIKYIMNPKKLIGDFSNSCWKLGFMKRLLKIRLPYYRIFKIIYGKG